MTTPIPDQWFKAGCKPSRVIPPEQPEGVDILMHMPIAGWEALWHAYRHAMAGDVVGLAVIAIHKDQSIYKEACTGVAGDPFTLAGALDKLKNDLLMAADS